METEQGLCSFVVHSLACLFVPFIWLNSNFKCPSLKCIKLNGGVWTGED
jgi:hypothetical protein